MNAKDPLVGKIFGGYRITDKIAQGGMAAVYRGIDRRLGRDVAIKLVLGGKQYSEIFLKRFRREIRILGKLLHPNIVPLLDFGSLHGVPYLVMPYLSGGTLQDDIARGKVWDWYEAAQLLIPIARALAYAHENGVVHRDVKPANILITESGDPMLSDFGLMKMLREEASADLTGSGMVGTPDYMAPEQWVGDTVPQTDMYALGIIFYVMVTGQLPYKADTAPEIMFKHISEAHLPPRKIIPDLPVEIEIFIERTLRKDYKKRFDSMAIFAYELEQLTSTLKFREKSNSRSSRSFSRKSNRISKWEWMAFKARVRALPLWVWAGAIFMSLLFIALFIFFSLSENLKQWQGSMATAQALQMQTVMVTTTPDLAVMENTPQPATDQDNDEVMPATPTLEALITPVVDEPAQADGFNEVTQVSLADGMTQVLIPAGSFMMGGNPLDLDAENDEKPQHEVYLDAYWIDQTEVSNGMYMKCVEASVCSDPFVSTSFTRGFYFGNPDYDDYPVINVSWYQASQYCKWAGRRLPTEAEWEKAATSVVEDAKFPWGNRLDCSLANYFQLGGSCGGDTKPVDAFPGSASFYGVMGMAGNVWEWVNDWYQGDYYEFSPGENPQGPDQGAYVVVRGGAFNYEGKLLRITNRGLAAPANSKYNGGFRCAMDTSDGSD
ncbi:MAG: SUMF1/EgtB/PvdO family nonheme iron enzyme [Anaerolineae bacterium]|nr:SUMF1/EgtB/PvdO family nonheme iron enzyme [Anaerolineae bacterium]